ncbi:unnamed protein product [Danaus chrysippus]|uniref:(African queen) hypothetical protein n=1 Tax=Danaus chrysippus TaxID=151541 RepID=A0A8J2RDT5_9NEOP|nr:unnamed protein product [Danaus chrysippus]
MRGRHVVTRVSPPSIFSVYVKYDTYTHTHTDTNTHTGLTHTTARYHTRHASRRLKIHRSNSAVCDPRHSNETDTSNNVETEDLEYTETIRFLSLGRKT